jgi:prepilin signal peptidase PulO-like enzyme (type II secretory pathway)
VSGPSPAIWLATCGVTLVWGLMVRSDRQQAIGESRRSDVVTAGLTIGIVVWLLVSGAVPDPVPDGVRFGAVGPVIVVGVLAAMTASQCVTDLVTHRLPLRSSHLSAAAIVIASGFTGFDTGRAAVVGAATMAVVALVVAVATRGSLGRGDVHVALPLGAALGAIAGWSVGPGTSLVLDVIGDVMTAWVITAVSAGLVVGALLITRRVSRTSHIPYGPFLTLGTLVVVGS